MTASESFQDSCGTIFIGQGISLHYNPQNKTSIYLSLLKNVNFFFFCIQALRTDQTIYFLFLNLHSFVFLVNSC